MKGIADNWERLGVEPIGRVVQLALATYYAAMSGLAPVRELGDRQFAAPARNRLGVADLTCVTNHPGWVYVAVIVDVFSRSVVGWQAFRPCEPSGPGRPGDGHLGPQGRPDAGTSAPPDRRVHYLTIRYAKRLAEAGAVASVGSRGDNYDSVLAQSLKGFYKT